MDPRMWMPLAETAGVAAAAGLSFWLGRRLSRLPSPFWALGYLIPLPLLVLVVLPRWLPRLELSAPFRWVMWDRTEYVVLAVVTSLMLATPLSRLPQRRQRIAVVVLVVVFVTCHLLPPFFLSTFSRRYFQTLETRIDRQGVCRQSTGYDCGPAAAVTALRMLGVNAQEGPIAILAHTTSVSGTPADSLCAAIERAYGGEGARCERRYFSDVAELQGLAPVIADIKYGFMVDHYVTVLDVADDAIVIGDPLAGKMLVPLREFRDKWRKTGIVVRRRGSGHRPGAGRVSGRLRP